MSDMLRIAVAGLGVVGSSVVSHLQSKRVSPFLQLVAVSARDKKKKREFETQNLAWYDDCVSLVTIENVDVIVELIGGESGIALKLVKRALSAGKHVVTANKAMLARHGYELALLAEKNNVILAYEASIAGGIPIVKTMREGLSGNQLSDIKGILSGTCNFILSDMTKNSANFSDTLKKAQSLGFAEQDPQFDIDGIDTAHKLSLLSSIAFSTRPDFESILVTGITNITVQDIAFATMCDSVIKLIGSTSKIESHLIQWVSPCFIHKSMSLAHIFGVDNAVQIKGDMVKRLMLQGPGAGGDATASAVLADLLDVSLGIRKPIFGCKTEHMLVANTKNMMPKSQWYMRIQPLVEFHKIESIFLASSVLIRHRLVSKVEKGDLRKPIALMIDEIEGFVLENILEELKNMYMIGSEVNYMPVLESE